MKNYFKIVVGLVLLLCGISTSSNAQSDLIITGVIDGPLSGGVPKAVEIYVVNNIVNLSIYGIGSANNGGGTDGEEFTFPAVTASAGDFLYIASEATMFNNFFGFMPDYTDSAASINGDDAIELFMNGSVVDVFGDINVDGTNQPWEYLDGWAYRNDGTGPDGSTFTIPNWSFSGRNELDGEMTNATAETPFPIGTYDPNGAPPPMICDISNLQITSFSCIGENLTIDGSFAVVNGSGNYTLTISGDIMATIAVSGDANGTVSFSETLTGPISGSADFTIADLGAAAACEATLTGVSLATCPIPEECSDLYISLIVDGDLSGGLPKVVKLCANDDIADLSIFGVGAANNGGGSDGIEFDGMTGGLLSGQCVFLTSNANAFKFYFKFDADYDETDGVNNVNGGPTAINGDDAIELFCAGSVVDVFGDPNVNGDFEPWDYTDSWAFRNTTTQNGGVFVDANWTFGGRGALDKILSAGDANPLIPCIPIVEVTDPCACGKPENLIVSGGTTARFYEVLQVTITPEPMPVESWELVSTDLAKPIYDSRTGTAVTSIPMTHIGGGVYEAKFWHEADLGYQGEVNNGLLTNPIEVTGACAGDCPLIPTMGQWALFILALMMSSLGLVFMFNHKRTLA